MDEFVGDVMDALAKECGYCCIHLFPHQVVASLPASTIPWGWQTVAFLIHIMLLSQASVHINLLEQIDVTSR